MYTVRAASVDITPMAPVPLAGFAARGAGVFATVHDRLEANAIALAHESGGVRQGVVLLSLDTLSVGQRIDDAARRIFGGQVVTFASHTHFAPALDAQLPLLGTVDPAYEAYVLAQLDVLKAKLDAAPARAALPVLGQAQGRHAVNRRRRAWGLDGAYAMRMLPNKRGPKNETISLLGFRAADDGAMLAAFWNYACHPVSFFDEGAVSSDYCGVVREALRAIHGAGLPCVFAQGFCGDTRPPAYGLGKFDMRAAARMAVKYLLQGRCFGAFSEKAWRGWASSLAACVVDMRLKPLGLCCSADSADSAAGHAPEIIAASLPLADMHQGGFVTEGARAGLVAKRVRLLPGFEILALSGEPVTGIAALLPAFAGVRLSAGYSGHMFGYLPTGKVLAEGGYEASGFRQAFSLPGAYRPDIDDVLGRFFKTLYER